MEIEFYKIQTKDGVLTSIVTIGFLVIEFFHAYA